MGTDSKESTAETYSFRPFHVQKVRSNVVDGSGMPRPRSGHRIVCDSNNLYSFGGYNPQIEHDDNGDQIWLQSNPLFQELWRYNFASRGWLLFTEGATLPRELASNAVIRRGNTLMVYGGTGAPFGYRCSNKLHVIHLDNDENVMLPFDTHGNKPIPQYGQALVYHQGYLYTIGGTTGFAYTCDIHRLDLKTGTWEEVYLCQGNGDYEPPGRYRHEVAFDGARIYILGGGTADEAFGFSKIHIFNIETRQWRKRRTVKDAKYGVPHARRCHGAVQFNTDDDIHVFISGGYDGDTVFDDIWKLELSGLRWTLIKQCSLPKQTYFHSSAVTPQGKMYVFGGIYEADGIERSNDLHSMWICVPKLSEMCWEAMVHYNPDLYKLPKDELINSGLPRSFVQRLQ